jgi:hypothetical protein
MTSGNSIHLLTHRLEHDVQEHSNAVETESAEVVLSYLARLVLL